MGLFAWLLARDGGGKRTRQPKATPGTAKASAPDRPGVYSVERSVTTLVRSGLKRQKTTRTTKEWRHGNCQVRHKTKAAATRCRNS